MADRQACDIMDLTAFLEKTLSLFGLLYQYPNPVELNLTVYWEILKNNEFESSIEAVFSSCVCVFRAVVFSELQFFGCISGLVRADRLGYQPSLSALSNHSDSEERLQRQSNSDGSSSRLCRRCRDSQTSPCVYQGSYSSLLFQLWQFVIQTQPKHIIQPLYLTQTVNSSSCYLTNESNRSEAEQRARKAVESTLTPQALSPQGCDHRAVTGHGSVLLPLLHIVYCIFNACHCKSLFEFINITLLN